MRLMWRSFVSPRRAAIKRGQASLQTSITRLQILPLLREARPGTGLAEGFLTRGMS